MATHQALGLDENESEQVRERMRDESLFLHATVRYQEREAFLGAAREILRLYLEKIGSHYLERPSRFRIDVTKLTPFLEGGAFPEDEPESTGNPRIDFGDIVVDFNEYFLLGVYDEKGNVKIAPHNGRLESMPGIDAAMRDFIQETRSLLDKLENVEVDYAPHHCSERWREAVRVVG